MVCQGKKYHRRIVVVPDRKNIKAEIGGIGQHATTIRCYVNGNLQEVAKWKEIRLPGTALPVVHEWTDFTDEEWEALKTMREADAVERSKVAVLNSIDNNTGALGMENDMTDGQSGAL